ncbi:cupin [Sphingobium phenoxybenzoativorans]|uniref:cupin n=1 Tax=Sphingobium phenoxybenzoativorans TaxID=1592790 RepID=UPI0008721878|nr:cupin [Sphingobium phenoxybenzoativorans]
MEIETFLLSENDWVPNNSRVPVVVYRGALDGEGEELAERFEALFEGHGWPPDWRDGIFDYHHYHSTAHEALGMFVGTATLELGGPGGRRIELRPGDALLLPTGTGHRCIFASADFQVVGAYPKGQDWDICREAPDDAARTRMAALPDPRRDPVTGESGVRTGA